MTSVCKRLVADGDTTPEDHVQFKRRAGRPDLAVERAGGRRVVRARLHATFPGVPGAARRAPVSGNGDVIAVRRMLELIARRAEHRAGGEACRSAS